MAIGKRIVEIRESKDISQRELATRMGYSSTFTISQIEKGFIELTNTIMDGLTEALDVSAEYILKGTTRDSLVQQVDYISKSVKVKNKLAFIKQTDYFLFLISFSLLLLSLTVKGEQRSNILVISLVFSLLLLMYVLLAKVFQDRNNFDIISISSHKKLYYRSNLNNTSLRKHKIVNIVLTALVIIFNLFFYISLIKSLYVDVDILSVVLIIFLLLIIATKVTFLILSLRRVQTAVIFILLLLFSVEFIFTSYYMMYLNMLNVANSGLIIIGVINLGLFLSCILITNNYLKTFNFIIE